MSLCHSSYSIYDKHFCHLSLSLIEKALCYQITFFMEFPVAFIERPRLYGDRVTFLVHWEDRSVTEEEVKNLIPDQYN